MDSFSETDSNNQSTYVNYFTDFDTFDILSGQGCAQQAHPGNKMYCKTIKEFINDY